MKKPINLLIVCLLLTQINKAQFSFSLNATIGQGTINCITPTVQYVASSQYSNPVSYSWTSGTVSISGPTANITQAGAYTVTASSGSFSAAQQFTVQVNLVFPTSTGPSSFVVPSNTPIPNYTFTALSPTINITHFIYTPLGGTITSNATTFIYPPGSPGTHWHCIVNNVNGCATCIGPNIYPPGAPALYVNINETANQKNTLQIFPNPSSGIYNISTSQTDRQLILKSINGAIIKNEIIKAGQTQIDCQHLQTGVYYIEIHDHTNSRTVVRLVKE